MYVLKHESPFHRFAVLGGGIRFKTSAKYLAKQEKYCAM
jgi:hypothetical protein